ncbi:MAG: addiction module toxin, HicA family [Candidatus Yanofskybacteria bacterium RIFCSPHIGHO2_02_FULL_43_15c]|uniref:Addiction module toxin, HicA family n=1 Tax=Candidatus Yanofskybacteria bacterium RIFCSPHIGHO2_02_FULL_43_15c TaxID=1802679 RepID=A0A1F8FGG7_9BACT|nr:MAG: addiction module toxin, HicA family [Candidatus Yanofskybacteria bacterium RIFCSPHIGHO2_02_FULL_43_15c]
MKRRDLVRHLLKKGCIFVREGAKHSVFFNTSIRRTSTVPRHNEVHEELAKKICKDLGLPLLKKK